MPSLNAFDRLEKRGLDLRSADAGRFNLNDNLETAFDLQYLFEVLDKYHDLYRKSPIFTAISVMANPDFDKIAQNNFQEYFYETFPETLYRYTGDNKAFRLWKEGLDHKLFVPELHGREHLNVAHWMKALRNGDCETRHAFLERVTGFVPKDYPNTDYQAAFLVKEPNEMELHSRIIKDAIILFEQIFGYKARYFVPPNGLFNNALNRILVDNDLSLRSTSKVQNEPLGNERSRKVFHWLGQKDRYGLYYITRNCLFEPGIPGKDWVDSCLHDISSAFRFRKPAIISTHRVNYIGSLNPANRDHGLNQLSILLQRIVSKWRDVEFISTSQLGEILNTKPHG